MRGELRLLSAPPGGTGRRDQSRRWHERRTTVAVPTMNADQRIAEWLSEEAPFDQDGPDDEGSSDESLGSVEAPSGGGEAGARRARPIERQRHRSAGLRREGPEARVLALLEALVHRIRKKPISALAVALGAGFVVGGALSSRIGRAMLAAGARHVARELLKQLL